MDLLDKITGILAPHICLTCGAEGAVMCDPCASALLLSCPGNCFGCRGLSFNFETCGKCRSKVPLKAVWVACDYRDSAKEIIHAYKFGPKRAAASVITKKMIDVMPEHDFIVTSIPTDSSRIKQRGFDHASKIAKKISLIRRLPYRATLIRTKTVQQVGSTKSQRIKQSKDLFYVSSKNKVKGLDVLLIDDVATTGATLISAAQSLKKAGAKNVYGLVFARKM